MKNTNENVQIKAAAVDTGVLIEYLSLNAEKSEEKEFLKYLED